MVSFAVRHARGRADGKPKSLLGGILQGTSRLYLIAKPFWTGKQHIPGFNYYAAADVEGETAREGAAVRGASAAVTKQAGFTLPDSAYNDGDDGGKEDNSESGMSNGLRFRHTRLNQPDLIPRAKVTTSNIHAPADKKTNEPTHSPSSSSPSPPAALSLFGLVPLTLRLYSFLYLLFHRTPRRIAWGWSIVMIALLILCTYLHVTMSYCQRDMSTALSKRDASSFYSSLVTYMLTILIASPLLSLNQYAKSQLALHWRIHLTNHMLSKYFHRRNYYYMQGENMVGAGGARRVEAAESKSSRANGTSSPSRSGGSSKRSSSGKHGGKSKGSNRDRPVDNPDQRLCDDIRAFTRSSLTFVQEFTDELFQVAAFAGILWSISPMLVLFLLVYAGAGTYLATAVFGVRLIAINGKQARQEADFRFSLVRVRTNAEAIAFYSGEQAELSYIYWRFAKIVRNLSEMANIQCGLALFKHGYGFLTLLIPPLTLAPLYFQGAVEVGVISQASMAFGRIFNSLNLVVSKMNELSKWRTGLERIWEMQQAIERQERIAEAHAQQKRRSISIEQKQAIQKQVTPIDTSSVWWSHDEPSTHSPSDMSNTIQIRPSEHLHLDRLMVCVQGEGGDQAPTKKEAERLAKEGVQPGERVLVRNLTVLVPSLQRDHFDYPPTPRGLLIMGRSGIGKSTLLRAIAGLWKNGSGTIHRPNLSTLLFLPQRPYMILGTLRQQLLYPFCPQTQSSFGGQNHPTRRGSGCDGHAPTEGENVSSSPLHGLRRRWPVSGSSSISSSSASSINALTSPTALSSLLSCSASPPPPSSSSALDGYVDAREMPSDDDLEYILSIVNLRHLTKKYRNSNTNNANNEQSATDKSEGSSSDDNDTESKKKKPSSPSTDSSSSSSSPAVGLDVMCDWSSVLSLGEAQRIAFSRILIHQPSYVFCDEITAALDAHNEELLYSALSKYAPRTCLVSVGHRPALLKHHSHVLHLQEAGQWELLEINEANRKEIDRITTVTTTT